MKKISLSITIVFWIFNCNGQVTFQKECGGQLNGNIGYSVKQTDDGGYIFVGETGSFGSNGEMYLIKTDSYGDTLWTAYVGSSGYDDGRSVLQTSDGGYILVGSTSIGGGQKDIFLVRTDNIGQIIWARTYGGVADEWGNSIALMNDGGFVIAGTTQSFGAGGTDFYLIRTDSIGNSLWTKTYGGAADDYGQSVTTTNNGELIICGRSMSFGVGNTDVYLLKTDLNGVVIWAKTFGGSNDDSGWFSQQTFDGGFITVAVSSSFGAGGGDGYIIKTNSNGNLLWSKTYGTTGYDNTLGLQQTADGGFIIVGYSYSLGGTNVNTYLIRTNASGDTLWTRVLGDTNGNAGYSIKQISDGYIITGTVDFGVGLGGVYLLKTDTSGDTDCPPGFRTTFVTTPLTQTTFSSTISNNPATLVANITPPVFGRGGDLATACFSVSAATPAPFTTFTLSPNPTTKKLKIENEESIIKEVEIYNVIGEKNLSFHLPKTNSQLQTEIDVSSLSPNIYFIKVTTEEGTTAAKFVKE